MLYLIGIGLYNEKDISLKGLEHVKSCEKVYLENYTSTLACKVENLEELYGKKIILAERKFVEDGSQILAESTSSNVCLLIIGDVFSATTHVSLYQAALSQGIEVEIIHNASIMTAIGISGLSLYKFGKTTSISWHDSNTPMESINANGPLHTLCLLDLTPHENKYMQAKYALSRLIDKGFDPTKKVVVCAQLGSPNRKIHFLEASKVNEIDLFPQCIIIPGDLHFMEQELLEVYV
jgi:diphthine synthase